MSVGSRVLNHPALGPMPARRPVVFTFAGREVEGLEGDTIAAALVAAGIRCVHPYCGMGHCYACHVTVDGVPGTRACIVPIHSGMQVEVDRVDGPGNAD